MRSIIEYIRLAAGNLKVRMLFIIKWIGLGTAIGILCGLLGSAFDLTVQYVLGLRADNNWILFFAPLGGVAIVAIYSLLRVQGQDTNTIISAVRSGGSVPVRLFPSIFLGTAITHLVGGSAGREGAALQMGGTIGSLIGRAFKLNKNAMGIAILAGMSGYFSALFGTPVTAAVFVITIIQIGVSIFDALIPCLISSFVAFGIASLLGIEVMEFTLTAPNFDVLLLLKTAGLAVLATLVSVIFYRTIHLTGNFFARIVRNPWVKAIIGGCAIITFTLIYGSQRYNGTGGSIIIAAVNGEQVFWWDWILKIVLTAITIGLGFKGGEIVPCFFIGATFGSFMGTVLGMDPGFAASVGLICVFCAATNSALASMILAVELFGAAGLPYYALACGISFILSGKSSLYSAQRVKELKLTFTRQQ